jgi:periplasmic divalent cation tolerance protein
MTDISIIYITVKDAEEAQRIGRALLDGRFVACVNIVEKIISDYWWEGKIVHDAEALLIAKTKKTLVTAVIEKVKSIHGYSCPCIVSLPVEEGNSDFLSWVRRETL